MAKREVSNKTDDKQEPKPGDNVPEGVFLAHLDKILKATGDVETAANNLKSQRAVLTGLRTKAKADGIMLGELDRALELAQAEEEGIESLGRVLKYAAMMRAPIGTQFTMFEEPRPTLDVAFDKGFRASMIGEGTETCTFGPGDEREAWLRGWHQHQKRLAEEMKPEQSEAVH